MYSGNPALLDLRTCFLLLSPFYFFYDCVCTTTTTSATTTITATTAAAAPLPITTTTKEFKDLQFNFQNTQRLNLTHTHIIEKYKRH